MSEDLTFDIESGEADAVGMLDDCAGREHQIAVENQVLLFIKTDGLGSRERDYFCGADLSDGSINCFGIDGCRFVTTQTEKHGAIGGVSDAGEGKRSVEFGLYSGYRCERIRCR